MTEPRSVILDRLRSYADHPDEVIPEPRPARRERSMNKPAPTVHRCPTCGAILHV